ncbi:hypothetical protein [Candidatus Amarolinea aalborgensis]|uniref:hypothetical protein n=1 Tax=Candidatus Amarolinea aalborgensis TaxID=2249329 RepID=UPI003BF9862B
MPQRILWQHLDDFILLSDDEILRAMRWLVERAHTLAEAAGAAPWLRPTVCVTAGRTQSRLVCSGGNTSVAQLLSALQND